LGEVVLFAAALGEAGDSGKGGVLKMGEVSPAGLKLLLDFEVGGGEKYYDRFLKRPTWPGGESGVTVGIGYDLGYTPRARFAADWHGLSDEARDRLGATIGVKGLRARERCKQVADIVIPWPMALEVFERATLPFWVAQTRRAFPGCDALPWDAFSALVSLVFNRGPSMVGHRRKEMVTVRDAVRDGDLARIAKAIRGMKRLWTAKQSGLWKRRDAEAGLVENAK
jgi:hypothetical protein